MVDWTRLEFAPVTEMRMPDQLIREWMTRCIQERGYLRFDDLHIDTINSRYQPKDRWIEGSIWSLREALAIRNENQWPFTVALGMSLSSNPSPMGVNFVGLNEVLPETDWSPPSLYLFDRASEDWRGGSQARELGAEYRPVNLDSVRAYLREWYDEDAQEYRRTLWLAG